MRDMVANRRISPLFKWCVLGLSLLACSQSENEQDEGEAQRTQRFTQQNDGAKSAAQQTAEVRTAGSIEVRQRLDQGEVVSVSLRLREDLSPAELAAARLTVERGLTAPGSKVTYNFRSGPGMGLLISSEKDLQSLIDNPQVQSFGVAHKLEPMLNDSREITGANSAFVAGYSGAGRTVAVLDSGIDGAHADLSGSIVDEACFCAANSCCPGGTVHAFGTGAAAEADMTDGHGTHVAGIITSDGAIAPRGIAPDTNIVAVRAMGGPDLNDRTAMLEWLSLYHSEIDAVNLSFGTFTGYYGDCDDQEDGYESFADAVHALRAAGTLSIAASGNYGIKNQLSFPACISGVVSVGATDKNDVPAEFSNASENLDLLAPGTGFAPLGPGDTCNSVSDCILSTGLGNTTNRLLGTSMATPHVAAAVARSERQTVT